jgi:hypothetical protein
MYMGIYIKLNYAPRILIVFLAQLYRCSSYYLGGGWKPVLSLTFYILMILNM